MVTVCTFWEEMRGRWIHYTGNRDLDRTDIWKF